MKRFSLFIPFLIITSILILSSLVTAETDLKLWKVIYSNEAKNCRVVTVSPDNKLLLSISNEDIKFRDLQTLKIKKRIELSGIVVFYPDSKNYILAGNGIAKYSIDGKKLAEYKGNAKCLYISPSGKYIATVEDQSIIILNGSDLTSEAELGDDRASTNFKNSVSFLSDDVLVVGGMGQEFILYSISKGKVIERHTTEFSVSVIAISPDKSLVFLGSQSGGKVLTVKDWSTVASLPYIKESGLIDAKFRPNSNNLILVTDYKALITFDINTGKVIDSINMKNRITSIDFDPSGNRLFVAEEGLSVLGLKDDVNIATDSDFHKMYTIKKTQLYLHRDLGADFHWIEPNSQVEVDLSEESYDSYYYWSRVTENADGKNVVCYGYLYKKHISSTPTTTIEDFKAYSQKLKALYKSETFENVIQNPSAYKNCYTAVQLNIASDYNTINKLEGNGIMVDSINDDYRFIVEMPFKELEEDWGNGWQNGDYFYAYIIFSRIGEYTNKLGQVFRIPVFKAIGVYDGYRFVCSTK